ncbi:MAG: lamin tail domain-containing protein [Akkermansiaceae bacterium]
MRTLPFLFLLFVPCLSVAAPVLIGDASFEGNNLDPGSWSTDLSPEWQETGGPSNGAGFEEYIAGFAADGNDHIGMNSGHAIWQDLGETYQANTIYTLTISAGNRAGQTNGGNQTNYVLTAPSGTIFASSSFDASTIPAGTFSDAPALIFDTASNPAAVGQTIRILLSGAGSGRSHFDHIRLDATSSEPDGSATLSNLPATDINPTSARLSGTVTDIGEGAPSITIFYGTGDGGTDPASWDSSIDLSGTTSGVYSNIVNSLAPSQSYFFTARATNSSGISWATPSLTFQTPANPPQVLLGSVTGITADSATVPVIIDSNGGDPASVIVYFGTSNGGTIPSNWDSSISLGTGETSIIANLTGLVPNTSYFVRAIATNEGGSTWTTATGSFNTVIALPPSIENRGVGSLTSSNANLRGEVTNTGFQTPTITLYYGTSDGGTSPGNWDRSIVLGSEDGSFSRFVTGLLPTTLYFYTLSATNEAGTVWASPPESFTTPEYVAPSVVINEIHFDESDKTERAEFIELHNPSDTPVDLSGYAFTSGINFSFPSGTILAPGGFLVVAEDPATTTAKFGVTNPLGPFANGTKLRNSGETITLSDPGGETIDEVTYSLGFPWPTVGDEIGSPTASPSIELINPLIDNDLGGSWRASGYPAEENTSPSSPVTLVAPGQSDWRYRNGLSYPADDATGKSWWDVGYDDSDDGEWLDGTTPIGFGDNDDATTVTGMQRSYLSLFARKEFTIAPGAVPSALTLRCYHDDGAIIYLNGIEAGRFSVDAGPVNFPPPAGFANSHEASWTEITVPGAAAFLVEGTNIIAIHGLNTNLNSSDFSLDAAIETLPAGSTNSFMPTPGAPNSSFATSAPPQIRQVKHTPEHPTSNDDVVITAKITSPASVGSVSLQYQIVTPGNYFCRYLKFNNNGTPNPDPRYEDPSNWISVAMNDAGNNGDQFAGDSTFSVTLPSSLQQNRHLIRYRISASDLPGNSITVPYSDDPQPNFAYFIYDGTPDWTGRIRPGNTPVTYPGSLMSSIPTYFLLTTSGWVNDSQFGGYRGSEYLWPGTMIYDGRVYDHIQYRPRGGVHRFQYGKNFWKFDFNRGHRFRARDRYGKRYKTSWDKLNFSSIVQQVNFNHRGEQGLFESTGFRLFQLAGVEACHTHHTQFYVIDDASPTGPTQYDTDYYGLYLAIEQMDGQYLDEHGLPDGNLYKIEGHSGDSNNQGPTQVSNRSDVSTFISAYRNGNPTAQWWRDNLDLKKYFSYRTIVEGIHHYDIAYGKNYFYYHNPETAKFEVHPWDLDLTWANNMYGNGNHNFKTQVAQNPAFNTDYQNRVRELMDLLYNNDEGDRVIDEVVKDVWAAGQPSLVGADRRLWDNHPRITSRDRYYDVASNQEFGGMIQLTKDYIASRGNWMTSTLLTNRANIPATPVITPSGGFLEFTSSEYSSPSGTAFSAMEWRLSEISNPGVSGYDPTEPYKFEIEDAFKSGELPAFGPTYTFPIVSARPGRTYRARVRHRDSLGRWSHWSAPVEFMATTPDVSVYQNALVISEIMFNPPTPSGRELAASNENDDFEFIEIRNVSNEAIDLTGVRFTKGINFDFADGTQLAPGAFILVVKNEAAFEARYGTGLPVAGNYGSDNLSNGGEQVKLSLGAGTAILDFIYDDSPPWPAGIDSDGASLTLVAPESLPDHALPASWRASFTSGGSPGTDEASPYTTWAALNGLSGNPEDDQDSDGISNLMEFALLGNPQIPGDAILPVVSIEGGFLTLTYDRLALPQGLSFSVEFSNDLIAWSGENAILVSSVPSAGEAVTDVWRFDQNLQDNPTTFARLKVTFE